MTRSASSTRTLGLFSQRGFTAALALLMAIGLASLILELLMAPPAGELGQIAAYLALSGGVTMLAGTGLLHLADRAGKLSLRQRALISAAIAGGVGLINVFIVAQLMFVSTSHDLKLLVALVGFSAIVMVWMSVRVADGVVRRIYRVVARVRDLAAGDYRTELEVEGGDEIAGLASDVNALARRLGAVQDERRALENERRELTAAISHDLRTPLASIRAMTEALHDGVVDDAAEVQRYYRAIRREIDRLSAMIEDLFELAQIDAGALPLDRRPVRLQDIAAEVVDAMEATARQKGVRVCVEANDPPPDLELDGTRMERVVANLLRNAIEHTPAGGEVKVGITRTDKTAVLEIADSGDGISATDLPHIWTRFYRAEKSRRRESPQPADGAGLGLAIVRGIVEAHQGSVGVDSEAGKGARFTIQLPIRR